MPKFQHINGLGDDSFSPESRVQIKIRTVDNFTIIINDEIVAPNSETDRFCKFNLEIEDEYQLITHGKWSMNIAEIPSNADLNNGETLVQEDEPMTLYEKMSMQMAQQLQAVRNPETTESIDEANDFSEEEEEYHSPLSKHEAKLMVDEYLIENGDPEKLPNQDVLEQNSSIDAVETLQAKTSEEKTTTDPTQ